jgi:hypothetical protein
MTPAFPVVWIFMLLMALIVFGALAAIFWRSWIVGTIVLLLVVLVPGLYMVRSSAVQTPAKVMFEETATLVPATRLEIDPETLRTADVYPSMQEGAKNLSLRLCDNLQSIQPPISAANIHIIAAKIDRNTEIVREVFAERFPQANVVANNSHDGDVKDLSVMFSITETGKTKHLKLISRQQGRDIPTLDTDVRETPWVANFDDYRSTNSKGEWIVGWSGGLETTKAAALQQARADAARQMRAYVVAKFPQLSQPGLEEIVRSRLESDLFRHKYSSEEFVQQVHMPATGENVYRAAVLADASSQQLERVRTTILPEVHRKTESVRRFGLGTFGLGVVICLVYLFLNWATRGYFQMNLRLGAFLVLIAGVLTMMLIA